MIMITTRQTPQPDQRPDQRRVRRAQRAAADPAEPSAQHAAECASEYVFSTVNGHYEVHVVRRGAGAWAVRLRGFALHRDGCFWPVPDAAPPTGAMPNGTRLRETSPRGEPTYPLDEAIVRTLHALVRLP